MASSLTLQEFGRRWYLQHRGTWDRSQARRFRLVCLGKIMPSLGPLPFAALEPTHVLEWLNGLLATESDAGARIAAYTLLELLEAATAHRLLSESQLADHREILASSAVIRLLNRRRAQNPISS